MFFNSFFRYFLYLTGTKFILAPRVFSDFEDAEQKKAFVEMHIRCIVVDLQEKKILTIEFKESEISADKKI